jgi:hypothetical protein
MQDTHFSPDEGLQAVVSKLTSSRPFPLLPQVQPCVMSLPIMPSPPKWRNLQFPPTCLVKTLAPVLCDIASVNLNCSESSKFLSITSGRQLKYFPPPEEGCIRAPEELV